MTRLLLAALRRAHTTILEHGFAPIADALNATWSLNPRRVRITLAPALGGATHEGHFHGVDDTGRLRLTFDGETTPRYYEATQIELLREQPDPARQC
ncbi:hypothetical protein [Geminisphaera colitermitum]|uniref:hypothetical protein n=1 Tax=Geminisphaera colitermitum TaxID=1148786 RepID=UPI001E61284B|nr:hypothetical protein [Geminisphaera colitermitum]